MKSRSKIKKLAKAAEGIPIWGSIPGSPADGAGVRYGDILLSVNGTRTKTFQDYVDAKRSSDGVLALEFLRDGDTIEVAVELAGSDWKPTDREVAETVAEQGYLAPDDEDDTPQKPN